VKAGSNELLNGCREIKLAAARRLIQDGQGADHMQIAPFGLAASGQIVQDDRVGMELFGQADGLPLSRTQHAQRGVWPSGCPLYFEPGRRAQDPLSHGGRRLFVAEFVVNGLWDNYPPVQFGQHINAIDQDEIIQR